MRTLSLVFAVALMVACEKVQTPTRTNHYVSVQRDISEDSGEEVWTMSVYGSGISFYHFSYHSYLSSDHRLYNLVFRGTDGQNALSVFNTFSQWAATARGNQVEQFSKRISSDCFLSSSSGGKLNEDPCEFSYRFSEGRLNETFTEKDIAKFSELLKQLPEVNAERLAKQSKAEQEQSLFKEGTAGNLKSENGVPTLPAAPPLVPMITLTQPVPIQTESGTVTLPVGTKLQFVSQINTKVHVHYLNRDYVIPVDATDLNRKRSKTAK
jgi:hypothetical protein